MPRSVGVFPWGADLHGFARLAARCDNMDNVIRMVWRGQHQFAVCRDRTGARYMRAWTTAQSQDLKPADRWIAMRGTFFTDTPTSVQFVADGAKVDIGEYVVTIVWSHEPHAKTFYSTSFETGPGWRRLD